MQKEDSNTNSTTKRQERRGDQWFTVEYANGVEISCKPFTGNRSQADTPISHDGIPKSIGSPEASVAELLEESMKLENPLGVPTLIIHPENFEKYSDNQAVFQSEFGSHVHKFFESISNGDSQKRKRLSEIFAQDRFSYIPNRTEMAARNKNYTDAHCASLTDNDAEPLCGIIVAPRVNRSFAEFAADVAGIDKKHFSFLHSSSEKGQFLSCWHEFSHCTGANEPQADKMAAIIFRKAFPDDPLLNSYADMRAIDAVLSYKNDYGRLENYGWPPVEAIDSVIAMSKDSIDSMDEQSIRAIRHEQFDFKVSDVQAVGKIFTEENPDSLKGHNLEEISKTGRKLLSSGVFGNEDDTRYKIASRFLLAVDRIASASLGVSSNVSPERKTELQYSP